MFQFNSALTTLIATAMLSGGLACSPPSAKPGGDGTQAGPSPTAANGQSALPGGKNDASVKDPGVIEAANFAVTAEQDTLKAQGKPQAITLVEIAAAQSQVVEGVSYTLTLHVKVDGQGQTAEAVVWVRAWLKGDDKMKLTSWKLYDKN